MAHASSNPQSEPLLGQENKWETGRQSLVGCRNDLHNMFGWLFYQAWGGVIKGRNFPSVCCSPLPPFPFPPSPLSELPKLICSFTCSLQTPRRRTGFSYFEIHESWLGSRDQLDWNGQNRVQWRGVVDGLCSTGSDGHKCDLARSVTMIVGLLLVPQKSFGALSSPLTPTSPCRCSEQFQCQTAEHWPH